MTHFRTYQACLRSVGWQPVDVPSSDGRTLYTVLVNPWGNPNENVCHCEGYGYRGKCRHQQVAQEAICHWTELDGIEQSDELRKARLCPVCGSPTKYEIEVDA